MAYKSPFSKEIYDEWDRLTFGLGPYPRFEREPLAEQVEGWEALHRKVFVDGAWSCSVDDASLVVGLGHTIAFRQYRYADGVRIIDEFLCHPDFSELDALDTATFRVWRGSSVVLAGDVDAGLQALSNLLIEPKPRAQSIRLIARNQVLIILDDLGGDDPVDPRLANFVREFLAGWNEHKRKARLALDCKTNRDLTVLLQSTYPPRNK